MARRRSRASFRPATRKNTASSHQLALVSAQDALVAQAVAPIELGFHFAPGPIAEELKTLDYQGLVERGQFIGQDRPRTIEAGLAAVGLTPLPRSMPRSYDDLTQLGAIRRGLGFGICQCRIARREGLIRLLSAQSFHLPAWLVRHEDQRSISRVRVVFDALVEALR